MRLIATVQEDSGGQWTFPETAQGEVVEVTVEPATLLNKGVRRAAKAAGLKGPHVEWRPVCFLLDRDAPHGPFVGLPRFVVANDGQALWVEAAKDKVTFADLERTKEAGYFEGDPYGLFLMRFTGGDGVIPSWEDFLNWLAAIAAAGQVLGWLRSKYRHYMERWARTPYAFLGLVTTRDAWRRQALQELLALTDQEAIDLLESMGYESDDVARLNWVKSHDPERAALRKQIRREQLHDESDDA
jgi:hypothetical protein